MIPLFYPYIPKEAMTELSQVLASRWIGQGPKVDLFEKEFNEFFNLSYSVAMNSGSSALETAYELANIQAGDEVISTPLTCSATNIPLLRLGAKIVWADILEDTLCIDPDDVFKKVNSKTKAIVQVHLGGIEAGLDLGSVQVGEYSTDHAVPIISDACQALGVFKGNYTCCSFQAIKHITTGDGGMLIVNYEKDYKKAKLLRWFGIDREKKIVNDWQCYKERKMTFDIDILGYKRQMTDIAASLGIVGLIHYNELIAYRKKLFNLYRENLKDVDGIKIIDGKNNTYWLMTILVENRNNFAKKLTSNNIDTNLVQIRNDIYKIFGGQRADLPVLNSIEEKYISLPLNMKVTETDVNYICDIIKSGW